MRSLFNKPIVLIAFALLIKTIMIFYITDQAKKDSAYKEKFITPIVLKTNDYGYFITPVENYVKSGVVYYTKPSEPFAGRMPGYWFPYFLIRFLFSAYNAITILILLQIFLSALSVYLLAKTVLNISKNKQLFYLVYSLFLFTPYILSFDISTQSESFAVSASVFHIYFLSNYFYNGAKNRDLILSGLFLAWVIFLRPFTGLAIIFVPFIFFVFSLKQKESIKVIILRLFLFCLAFIVFDAVWTVRNYVQIKKIIPLESSLEDSYGKLYSKSWVQIRQMIVTMGEDAAYFEPGTMSAWFKKESDSLHADNYSFRKDLFEKVSFTKDSLIDLKNKYHEYMKETDPEKERLLNEYCINTAKRYQKEYTSGNFLKVYVIFPCKRFSKFVFNSGSSYLPLPPFSQMVWHQKIVKLFSSLTYYITILMGFAGIILMFLKRRFDQMRVILLTHIIVIIGLVVFYIDIQENRYLMTVFPCFILFAADAFNATHSKLLKKA